MDGRDAAWGLSGDDVDADYATVGFCELCCDLGNVNCQLSVVDVVVSDGWLVGFGSNWGFVGRYMYIYVPATMIPGQILDQRYFAPV